jgi:predicted ATPase/Tfp pilus assembly protein PilF
MIGEGGMGRVYAAQLHGPAGFHKLVALKLLRRDVRDQHPHARDRFVREGRLGGLLRHPNIVDTYELGEYDDTLFVAMEFVDGPSLGRLIRRHHNLPSRVALDVALQACSGLAHAHTLRVGGRAARLVHCDLKPANLLVDRTGQVKVADLGIARVAQELGMGGPGGGVVGTRGYMSPEQVFSLPIEATSDLFAMGVMLFEMVCGARLFQRASREDYAQALTDLEHRLPAIGARVDALVRGLGDVVCLCLRTRAADRFGSADELAAALRTVQAHATGPSLAGLLGAVPLADSGGSEPSSGGAETVMVDAASTPRGATNLSTELDSFFGRQADLEVLAEHFRAGARVVTLKGIGGTGKTRLSRRFGTLVVGEFPGGVWFCDLTEARSVLEVCQAVAGPLSLPLGSGDMAAVVALVGRAIAGRGPTLLVLDNFEQIVHTAGDTLAQWLELAPQARFLVTSRELLRLTGEVVIELGPLSDGEAVALLVARADGRGKGLAGAGPEVLQAIVSRLDKLPLAIELAAARAGLVSPEQLLERLDQRFRVLANRKRAGVTARQATMRGAIDWSWDLLGGPERAALAQLSVFRGGFTLDAAEAVVDLSVWPDAPWTMDVVGELWERSLLVSRDVDGLPRFSMYESIREYAEEKMDGTQLSDLQRRHAHHFAELGDRLAIEALDHRGGVRRRLSIVGELGNLVAATDAALEAREPEVAARCCQAAGRALHLCGPFELGITLTTKVLNAIPPNSAEHAVLLADLAKWHDALGRFRDGVPLGERAVARAVALERRDLEANALATYANLLQGAGDFDAAKAAYRRALDAFRELGDRRMEGVVIGSLALVAARENRNEEAEAGYLEALAVHRSIGNRRFEGVVLGNLALVLRRQLRRDEARVHLEAALVIQQEVRDRRFMSYTLNNLGKLLHDVGESERGLQMLEQSLAMSRELGDANGVAGATLQLAVVYENVGNREDARAYGELALGMCEELGFARWVGIAQGLLGRLSAGEGRVRAALGYLEPVATLDRDDEEGVMLLAALAECRARTGDLEGAHEALDRVGVLVADLEPQAAHVRYRCARAWLHFVEDDPLAARSELMEANVLARALALEPHLDVGYDLVRACEAMGL